MATDASSLEGTRERFNVVLLGTTLPGQDVATVAAQLASLIKRDIDLAVQLLRGQSTKIKSVVDAATGARYMEALERIGVAARLEPETLEVDAELSVPSAIVNQDQLRSADQVASATLGKRFQVGVGLHAVAKGEQEAEPAATQQVKSFASKVVERAFCAPQTEAPTNAVPWVLTSDLVLYGDHLVDKGQSRNYSAISSVSYHAFRHSLNYIPTSVQNALELEFDDGGKASIRSIGAFIETGKHKRISSACHFLSSTTFQQRVRRYQNLLKDPGYFDVRNVFSNVRIYANGDIEKNGLRLSIASASEHRALQFGTEWGTRLSGGKNPYAIIVGESGTGLFAKKIKFAVTKDQDVVSSLIKYFANEHVTVFSYSDNALKIDKVKQPKFALGRVCANCCWYRPERGQIIGRCRAFEGKAVAPGGWCNFWSNRT